MTDETTGLAPSAPAEVTTPAATEAPAAEVTNEQTTEAASAETTGSASVEASTTDEGDDGDEPKKKKPPGSERLKRRLQLLESDLDRIVRENEELKARTAPVGPDGKREGRPGIDREPTDADFPNDFFAYERALTAWNTRQAVREEINRERETATQRAQRELHTERIEAYEEHAETVRERIPDFDKVIRSAKDVTVKPAVVDELLASEKPALLQYHLAKNPDLVRDLNAMSPRELAKAIGRLEATVHLPRGKQATEASPPPAQVKGGAAPAFDPFKSDDMGAYVEWRRKQLEASRRR